MKTTELINMLAAGDVSIPRRLWFGRHALAVSAGLAASLLAVLMVLGIRDDIAQAVRLPMFWIKQGFPLILALAAFMVSLRLSRPGTAVGQGPRIFIIAVFLLWVMGLFEWLGAVPDKRQTLLFGSTWRECLLNVPLLSIPTFLAVLLTLRTLAPTNLALAGGAAGALAGCVGAFAYAIHCPELTATFMGVWYMLGISISAIAGVLSGPVLLRW